MKRAILMALMLAVVASLASTGSAAAATAVATRPATSASAPPRKTSAATPAKRVQRRGDPAMSGQGERARKQAPREERRGPATDPAPLGLCDGS
jgi:hypothetical protein